MRLLVFALVLLSITSCSKEHTHLVAEGDYSGTFQRVSATGSGPVSHVTLHLRNGSFSGSSDSARYPAICVGKWSVADSLLHFESDCVWTADFDWSYVLGIGGDFSFEVTGRHLKMWRTSNSHTDRYELDRTD